MKDVLVINNCGFSMGGDFAIGRELHRLGFLVIVSDKRKKSKVTNSFNIPTYKEKDLVLKVLQIKPKLIILNLITYAVFREDIYAPFYEIKKKLPNTKIVTLHCNRTTSLYKKEKALFEEIDRPLYDHVFTLTEDMAENYRQMGMSASPLDMNVFTFSGDEPNILLENKKNIIASLGRWEGVKGSMRYAKDLGELISKGLTMVHEGMEYLVVKGTEHRISGSMQVVNSITTGLKTKEPLPHVHIHKDYTTQPVPNKFNAYNHYDYATAVERWKSYKFVVCPIMGTGTSTFTENALIKQKNYWNKGLEYVYLEALDNGIPIIFSEEYARVLGLDNEVLTYGDFRQIPDVVAVNDEDYIKLFKSQYKIFKDKQDKINSSFVAAIQELMP